MESTTKLDTNGNESDTKRKVNWALEKSLLKITKGESDHTFEFYFSEQNISAKITFQKEGHFFLYDSQLDKRVKRKVQASITGRVNWTDEHTSEDLIRAIIAWEEQRTVDSNALRDHWINYYRPTLYPDQLYGGFRFSIGPYYMDTALISMKEAHKKELLKSKPSLITLFP